MSTGSGYRFMSVGTNRREKFVIALAAQLLWSESAPRGSPGVVHRAILAREGIRDAHFHFLTTEGTGGVIRNDWRNLLATLATATLHRGPLRIERKGTITRWADGFRVMRVHDGEVTTGRENRRAIMKKPARLLSRFSRRIFISTVTQD